MPTTQKVAENALLIWTAISELAKIATPIVIGFLAYRIARWQANTAYTRFKFDLFNRRFEIYIAVDRAMDAAIKGREISDEEISNLTTQVKAASFLLEGKVLEEVCSAYFSLAQVYRLQNTERTFIAGKPNLETQALLDETRKLVEQLKPIRAEIGQSFEPLLNFKHIK